MKRYETSTHIFQISEYTFGEDMEEIDAMELHPRDNTKKIFHGNDRGNRNFGPIRRGSFGQNVSQERRQNLENNPKGDGRGSYNQGQNRTFCSKYQDGSKPAKWDATFQAYDINSKSLLEALKKLAAYNILKQNEPKTNDSRQFMQYNPNLQRKFTPNAKQETSKQNTKENMTTAKEIAEAFSAVTGQEISEEEVFPCSINLPPFFIKFKL